MRPHLLVGTGLLLIACGGDPPVDLITGQWSASWTMTGVDPATGGLLACYLGPRTLDLQQTGGAFDGSYGSGLFRCTVDGTEIISFTGPGGRIVDGTIQSNAVVFYLDVISEPDDAGRYQQLGTINSGSMNGTAVWGANEPNPMAGTWTAIRQ